MANLRNHGLMTAARRHTIGPACSIGPVEDPHADDVHDDGNAVYGEDHAYLAAVTADILQAVIFVLTKRSNGSFLHGTYSRCDPAPVVVHPSYH